MTKMLLKKWNEIGTVEFPKLLLMEYRALKLTEVELILILQISEFQKENNFFPTPELLSTRMTISPLDCSRILGQLVHAGFLEVISSNDTQNRICETYSLDPLWDKLLDLFLLKENLKTKKVVQLEEKNVFLVFEQEFGRPLSPFECETINLWLDQDNNSTELILFALKEAVISGKLNFRYIDRILFEWNKNNIKSVEQAMEISKKFRKNGSVNKTSVSADINIPKTLPTYNWMD